MTLFNSAIQLDAASMTDDFGEPIVYLRCPNGIPLLPLSGNAIVDRPGQQRLHDVDAQLIELDVPRVFAGVTLDPRLNEDKVLVADRQGRPPAWHVVNKILSQDAGMYRLQLR